MEADIEPSTSTQCKRTVVNECNNSDVGGGSSRKRRASNSAENDVSAKRFNAQDDDDDIFKLLDFTDEVLLEILQNCDCMTLYALSKTCKHFLKLVEDRRLWKSFDFATKKMMGRQIKKLLLTLQVGDITEFKVRGFVSKYPIEKWKNNTITPNILRKLSSSCPNLEVMEIREGYINFQQVKIADFPTTLKQLIFYGCQIAMPRSPRLFQRIDEHLQLLEEISLEKCPWFETHDLVVFSKLPHLKRLILRGCASLKGCVPYGSIATRFGFKCLQYLDVRDTPITDSDIQCFNVTSTLREILMDCPDSLRLDSDNLVSTDDEDDDDDDDVDDGEPFEPSTSVGGGDTSMNVSNGSDANADGNHKQMPDITDSESDSNDESECSTDSEDGMDGGGGGAEDGSAKASGSNDDAGAPQAHCIQVILQNGRMINVNAERSNDPENAMRGPNSLRCVIGIINGRDSGEPFAHHRVNPVRVNYPVRHQRATNNQQDESNAQAAPAAPASTESPSVPASASAPKETAEPTTDKLESNNDKNDEQRTDNATNAESNNEPGPSGLQQTQNQNNSKSPKATQSNPSDVNNGVNANGNNEPGPSNRNAAAAAAANQQNVETRQRLIIVHHRRHNGNDENGNMNRRISWEVRNMYPIADAPVLNCSGNYITDRGMCSFGMPRRNVQEGIIWIRAELRPPDTLLERITVRNYIDVTDVTLRHLALCAPNLRYLDVTGTSVTKKGIATFLKDKPDCQVISELLDT